VKFRGNKTKAFPSTFKASVVGNCQTNLIPVALTSVPIFTHKNMEYSELISMIRGSFTIFLHDGQMTLCL